jgi:hypothetical protein
MRGHGESWRPLLEGRRTGWRDSWLYENFEYPGPHCAPKARGVRTSRYKLVHYLQQPVAHEFFDLEKDPEERRSLYDDPAYRQQVAQLTAELDRLRTSTADDRGEDGTPAPVCANRMAPAR